MTARAYGLVVCGIAALVSGWIEAWPELSALGAAAIALVVAVFAVAGRRPSASVSVATSRLQVVRGQRATVRVRTAGARRGWLRLVDGPPAAPLASMRLRRQRGVDVALPVDTSRRGQWPLGPYAVVQADPWALVRRVAGSSTAGTLTVYPRTVAVRASVLRAAIGDSDRASRRIGDQHFHALRDYVLGDEPRMVHWRSSARAGKLVVRQQVAAATTGTVVLLDVDTSAYGSDDQFGSGWLSERFESAVEVAASIATSQRHSTELVHVVTNRRGDALLSAPTAAPGVLLDAFATVQAVAPVDLDPPAVVRAVRRARPANAVVVTGTPAPPLVQVARQIAASGVAVTLVRIGCADRPALAGLRVLDVASMEELS